MARLVLGRGLVMAGIGVMIGAAAAMALLRLLRDWPVTEQATLPTFSLIAAGLVALALIASAVPALRVTSANPVTALGE